MADSTTAVIEQPGMVTAPAPAEPDAPPAGVPAAGDALVCDEVLVEEISIDGMCGVY